ncbi:MAG TPA: 4-hydroxy-tetrahydrodipicolinate reductase [Conexivisphaerales archaeon]|nr:4-hydroxy-tetrahydrodipicolinate reductase [Conexivisphaerales archaeon]
MRVCVAGAAGRMGSMVAHEVSAPFVIGGAVESTGSPKLGMTLKEAAIAESDVLLSPSTDLERVMRTCDVFVSFTNPEAELTNLPAVVRLGKPVVVGTTGFSAEQRVRLDALVEPVPAVVSPNFSVGANFLFALTRRLGGLPSGYDFSIVEAHHSRKGDAPSGTAARLADIIREERGYTETVYGRSGASLRKAEELEVLSIRGGGIPGEHEVLAAGQFETIKLEHIVFSRSAFAAGALLAAGWVLRQKPGRYGMEEVLGLA